MECSPRQVPLLPATQANRVKMVRALQTATALHPYLHQASLS